MDFDEQASDGVHQIHYDNDAGQFERIEHFDYDEIDRNLGSFEPEPDSTVTMSDAAACFSLILEFCLKGDTLASVGARCASLAIYLNPTHNSKFGSTMAEIAREAGSPSRAALSKALMDFRSDAGIFLSAGKRSEARGSYRAAQIKSLEAGTHSSFTRKDSRSKKRAKRA
jgi:hypothetical protein